MKRQYNHSIGKNIEFKLKDQLHDVISDYLPESKQNDEFMDRTKSVECVNMLDSLVEVIEEHLKYGMEQALK
jgi:hypothetical protein